MPDRLDNQPTLDDPVFSTFDRHSIRIALLIAATVVVLGWTLRHTEASFADGLRYIRQANEIHRGDWRAGLYGSIDHPLHPLGIVAAHHLVAGDDPVSWQQAAVALGFACLVLAVIPIYLLARETFGDGSAWLGCLLVVANPLLGSILANVLSESTFLLFWAWGLWAAIRFLREGRFLWLPMTIGFAVLAYLSRPEGLLLPLVMILTLLLLPLHRAIRIDWPRWGMAVVFLVGGSLLLAGPYMALKGGVGTKPALARVLGLAPSSHPQALERERPLPPGQTTFQTYVLATQRMARAVRGAVSTPLLPLALLGLILMPAGPARARIRLFLLTLLAASAVGLVRLHATGGYCTIRHGLVPALVLILAAAHGLFRLMAWISIPGGWLGAARERLHPGPAVWAAVLAILIVVPRTATVGGEIPGPFHLYRDAGAWLGAHVADGEQALDLTDWPLYFSQRPGYRFAHVYDAPTDPSLRWVVVRRPHLEGHGSYSKRVRQLVGDASPVAVLPANPAPGQLQLLIFDRRATAPQVAGAPALGAEQPVRR